MKIATLPHEIKTALETLLAYLSDSERSDYQATPASGREQHIYRSVIIARQWLNYQTKPAPILLDAMLDIKRIAGKSGDSGTDPYVLLELIANRARDAIRVYS